MFKNREITFNSYKNLYRKNLDKYVKKKNRVTAVKKWQEGKLEKSRGRRKITWEGMAGKQVSQTQKSKLQQIEMSKIHPTRHRCEGSSE